MIVQLKNLGLFDGTDRPLLATYQMISTVTDAMEELDANRIFHINGFDIVRKVTGSVFENETLIFDDAIILQISESIEGSYISFVNVEAVISDLVIQSLLMLI